MSRIKVTGYLDADDYDLDPDTDFGPLSSAAHEEILGIIDERTSPRLKDLQDVEFELEDD